MRGSNVLKGLRTKQFTNAWPNLKPSAIALNFNNLRNGGKPLHLLLGVDGVGLSDDLVVRHAVCQQIVAANSALGLT